MDETLGRKVAAANGIKVRGILGVIEQAAQRNLLDFQTALECLQKTGIFLAEDIVAQALARNPPRRQKL